jgi:uncharacterized phage protein gp47/JayE
MPFDRPPLEAIQLRIKQDLENRLAGANPRLRVNNLRVFSEVEAGSAHLLYGRLEWNFRQLFPDLADTDQLIRWASIWGIYKSPATRAFGPCVAMAEPGSSVQTGDLLQLEGGTVRYRIRLGVPEVGGEVNFTVEALDYGSAGNVPPGTVLRFLTARTGIEPVARTTGLGIVGGAPEDTDDQLLFNLLRRIRQPPHGGNANDYLTWMYEVSGVTRAWCYPLERGLGTVALRFVMDDVRATGVPGEPQGNDGIPTNGDCQVVWDHIDVVRPVTADLGPDESLEVQPPPPAPPGLIPWGWGYVFPPYPIAQPVTITALEPDTLEIRAAIADELRDMMRNVTAPGETVFTSLYYLAIGNTPGVRRFRLVEPAADVTVQRGEIVVLGPITYV